MCKCACTHIQQLCVISHVRMYVSMWRILFGYLSWRDFISLPNSTASTSSEFRSLLPEWGGGGQCSPRSHSDRTKEELERSKSVHDMCLNSVLISIFQYYSMLL